MCAVGFCIGLGFGHAAQLAEGHAFADEQRDADEAASREGDQPENDGGCRRGFFLYAEQECEGKERSGLGAATDGGKLDDGADHGESENDEGGGIVEFGEAAAEAASHPEVDKGDEEPVGGGVKGGHAEIGEGADGAEAEGEAGEETGEACAEAGVMLPFGGFAFEVGGAVEAEVDEEEDEEDDDDEKSGAGGANGVESGIIFGGAEEGVGDEAEGEAGECKRRDGVPDAFEDVDAEHAGDGEIFAAGDEERANGFAGAAEEKDGSEAHERGAVDAREAGRAQIAAEAAPAEGAEAIAGVDGDEGEQEKFPAGVANGVGEVVPGDGVAITIDKDGDDGEEEEEGEDAAEVGTHSIGRVAGEGGSVN